MTKVMENRQVPAMRFGRFLNKKKITDQCRTVLEDLGKIH